MDILRCSCVLSVAFQVVVNRLFVRPLQGSYAGARAAHMRVLYPDLVFGAIASSGTPSQFPVLHDAPN